MELPQPYDGDKPYIFISYAHRDSDRVMPIVETLCNHGYRVWYDQGIDPGTEWDETIAAHVEQCGCFVALMSKSYLASSNCKDELNYARDCEKERLIVYLEDVALPKGMAMRINRLQAIFKHKYNDEAVFYEKLFSTPSLDVCLDTNVAQPPKIEAPPAKESTPQKPVETHPPQTEPKPLLDSADPTPTAISTPPATTAPTPSVTKSNAPHHAWQWVFGVLSIVFALSAEQIISAGQTEEDIYTACIGTVVAAISGCIALKKAIPTSAAVLASVGIFLSFSPCVYFLKAGACGVPITVMFYVPFILTCVDLWIKRYKELRTYQTASIILFAASVLFFVLLVIVRVADYWWLAGSLLCALVGRHLSKTNVVAILNTVILVLTLYLCAMTLSNAPAFQMERSTTYIVLFVPVMYVSFFHRKHIFTFNR